MLYIIGPLFTILVLFALCRSGEHALDSQQEFWIQNQRAMGKMRWGWSY
jgi:hypothetical protein